MSGLAERGQKDNMDTSEAGHDSFLVGLRRSFAGVPKVQRVDSWFTAPGQETSAENKVAESKRAAAGNARCQGKPMTGTKSMWQGTSKFIASVPRHPRSPRMIRDFVPTAARN